MVDPVPDNKNNRDTPYFLSCDWGTSSFRLHLAERETGAILSGISNAEGTIKIYDKWSRTQGTVDKIAYYKAFLEQQISDLNKKVEDNLNKLPIVISGMASSSIGMKELPYSNLPLKLNQPNIHVETFKATDDFMHDIFLISGVRSESDVMRGEESELVGIFESTGIANGLYILAGTHSKHVYVENKRVIGFRTYMTGELFNLLLSKSILSNSIQENTETSPGPSFREGVSTSLDENILRTLFSIRANDVLNQSNRADNYDYLSGLLIGSELRDIHHISPEKIVLAGNENLRKYYAEALDILELSHIEITAQNSFSSTSLGHSIILKQQN